MGSTRIKICGVTRADDARHAARLGADAIGLVFHRDSARALDVDAARAVVGALPPFVTAVGLFLDAEAERVRSVLDGVSLDELQFHGGEASAYCRSFGRPYVKAVAMGGAGDVAAEAGRYPDARGLLVDSHAPGTLGGTGESFAWDRLPGERDFRLILAGGLTADNVAAAVTTVGPDAVDVSSGVERGPGIKDEDRVRAFIEEVRRGDRNRA